MGSANKAPRRQSRARAALLLALALAVFVVSLARSAAAEISICVEVRAPAADLAGLRRLVESEIARHPSHHQVESGCRSHLLVELFEAGGARYLTAQLEHEVPVRFALRDALDLGDRLTEAVKLVLHNDPVYLTEDITHYSKLQRLGHSIGALGRFHPRVEIFEAISRGGTNAVFAPGAAFMLARGSGNWEAFGRVYLGGWPVKPSGADRALQVTTGLDAGLTFELLENAFASPYFSAALGAQFLRYAGRAQATTERTSYLHRLGLTASLRAGVRLFRWSSFDLDLFAQGYLPLFLTRDADGAVFGENGLYTPSLQLGIGVGF